MARKKKAAVEASAELPVSAQTTPVAIEKPVRRVVAATEREAKAITGELRKDFEKFQSGWWEMGQRVKDALDRQVPAAMEMNAHDWMLSVFGETASVAKIQRSLRIARALTGIPEEKVKLLTEGKAYLLTQLKPNDRAQYLDVAITIPNDQFAAMVEEKRQEYGITPDEKRAHITVQVPESVAAAWDEAEKKVARLAELDIELKPGLRAQVFEIIATMINTTPDEVLLAETTGGEAVHVNGTL